MPTHSETRRLPHTAHQMFDLVADVESYPEFLPWTAAARIRSREPVSAGEVLTADMVVSFKVFRESFTSRVTLREAEMKIDTEYVSGPFRRMQSNWGFADLAEGGCEVSFFVDYEFKNRMLQAVAGRVFNEAMQRIVRAFERRAATLYGSRRAPA